VPSFFHFETCSKIQEAMVNANIHSNQDLKCGNTHISTGHGENPLPVPDLQNSSAKVSTRTSTKTSVTHRVDSNSNKPSRKSQQLSSSSFRSLRDIILSASKRQWLALIGFCYVNFVSNSSITVLSSFFTQEAVNVKGTNDFMVGLIFGMYAVVNAATCPIFGYFTAKVGAKRLVLSGLMISGIMSFFFSQLWRFDTLAFVSLCFMIRALQAIGCSAYYVGATVIISEEWREDLTFAMGLGETFTGIGMIAGPILGGYLYEIGESTSLGGFQLPFCVICVMMLVGFVFCYYAMEDVEEGMTSNGSFFSLLKIPSVFATCLFIMIMWASMDFNMPSLGEHMERNQLRHDPVLVGFMFVILALVYTAAAPLVGLIVKDDISGKVTMLVGGLIVAFSFLLIGPSPVFQAVGLTKPTLTLISISMATLGFGLGLALVPNFQVLLQSAINGGMQSGVSTAGLVGGIFNSVTFIGEFIGPFMGGALLEQTKNFQVTTSIFSGVLFFLTCVVAGVYICSDQKSKPRYDQVDDNDDDCFIPNTPPPAYGTFIEV